MDSSHAVGLCQEAIRIAILISAPVLLAGVTIGLMIGLLQALTQIQEQTIAIVLKILVMVVVLACLMPWMTWHMLSYSTDLFFGIPESISPLDG